jgi:hypothetical protein
MVAASVRVAWRVTATKTRNFTRRDGVLIGAPAKYRSDEGAEKFVG